MTAEEWAPWVAAAIGLVNLIAGIQAYRGRYQAWLLLKGGPFPGWPGLASLYLGVAFTLLSVSPLVLDHGPPLLILAIFFTLFPSLGIGIIGMFWLPSFMLPAWIKETRRKMRAGEDRYSRAIRPGGALYRRLGVDPRYQPGGTEGPPVENPDGERRTVIRRED
ncbi:hypothetical protein ACT3S2_14115 [Arthrobacter sp. AOP36-A1-22]|uniref:hypothetical protein n=1 Tax=Arthrobacter sp. AOP36-A1-22 TaxID=3457684 RepID=UPI00403461FC